MDIVSKFKRVIELSALTDDEYFEENYSNDPSVPKGEAALAAPVSAEALNRIRELVQDELPQEFVDLYSFADGQTFGTYGVFIGEEFCTSKYIIDSLEFSKSLVKTRKNTIANPEASSILAAKMADLFSGWSVPLDPEEPDWASVSPGLASQTPRLNPDANRADWHKVVFTISPDGTLDGIYVYMNENDGDTDRIATDYYNYDDEIANGYTCPMTEIASAMHHLEKDSYEWDKLKFVIYKDGTYEFTRLVDDSYSEYLTSTPKGAIKPIYFHVKWVPMFSDSGGNYIGIDLDPDVNGVKGQVIIFGKNEDDMYVFANSLGEFFDKVIAKLETSRHELVGTGTHLHDLLKRVL